MPNVLHSWTVVAPNLTCQGPQDLKNQYPTSINPSQFTCPCDESDFSDCPCVVRLSDRSVLINCSDKNMTALPSKFPNASDFKIQLNLSLNRIGAAIMKNSSKIYSNIHTLDLSRNGLTSDMLDHPWWGSLAVNFPQLKKLDLSYNNLSTVSNQVLQAWNGSLVFSGK